MLVYCYHVCHTLYFVNRIFGIQGDAWLQVVSPLTQASLFLRVGPYLSSYQKSKPICF
uniref:Uncharacterized protein n=1 Tax=Anguilla anguilla TaxID=7936 RepID=A0A0E9WC12_ANGAN